METEFAYNMQLKGIEQSQIDKREAAREKGQIELVKLILNSLNLSNKERNLPAVKFESNEHNLDGFDLAEFGPK